MSTLAKRLLWRYANDTLVECGLDECGYGSLAGPVVAAAVIWPSEKYFTPEDLQTAYQIRDSKATSPTKRAALAEFIKEHAIDWSISARPSTEVDTSNVLIVRNHCFHDCIKRMNPRPHRLLVDGSTWDHCAETQDMEVHKIKKGDDTYLAIACASIIGKVWRDEYMRDLHNQHPVYHWNKNKGYGAQIHIDAIRKYGLTRYHRTSWRICREVVWRDALTNAENESDNDDSD